MISNKRSVIPTKHEKQLRYVTILAPCLHKLVLLGGTLDFYLYLLPSTLNRIVFAKCDLIAILEHLCFLVVQQQRGLAGYTMNCHHKAVSASSCIALSELNCGCT